MLAPEPRDGRLVVALPGERLAWFPTSDEGLAYLARERRILRVVAERCGFASRASFTSRPPAGIGNLELIEPLPGWEDRAVARWKAARRARRVRTALGVAVVVAAAVAIAVVALG